MAQIIIRSPQQQFDETSWKAFRGEIIATLNASGFVQRGQPPRTRTGFIIVPRGTGYEAGIYHHVEEHTDLETYHQTQFKALRLYKRVLAQAGFTVNDLPAAEGALKGLVISDH